MVNMKTNGWLNLTIVGQRLTYLLHSFHQKVRFKFISWATKTSCRKRYHTVPKLKKACDVWNIITNFSLDIDKWSKILFYIYSKVVNEMHIHFLSEAIKRVTHLSDKSVQIKERMKGTGFFSISPILPLLIFRRFHFDYS